MTDLLSPSDDRLADSSLASPSTDDADRRTFRAGTLDDAVAAARAELGPDVELLEAHRVRRGGLGGFFATDLGVEIVAIPRRADAGTPSAAVPAISAADALGELLHEVATQSTPSTEAALGAGGHAQPFETGLPLEPPSTQVKTALDRLIEHAEQVDRQAAVDHTEITDRRGRDIAEASAELLGEVRPAPPTTAGLDLGALEDGSPFGDGPRRQMPDDVESASPTTERPWTDGVPAPTSDELDSFEAHLRAELAATRPQAAPPLSGVSAAATDPTTELSIDTTPPPVADAEGDVLTTAAAEIVEADVVDTTDTEASAAEIDPLWPPDHDTSSDMRSLVDDLDATRELIRPVIDTDPLEADVTQPVAAELAPPSARLNPELAGPIDELDDLLRRVGVEIEASVVDDRSMRSIAETIDVLPTTDLTRLATERLVESVASLCDVAGSVSGVSIKVSAADGSSVELAADLGASGSGRSVAPTHPAAIASGAPGAPGLSLVPSCDG